MYFFIFKFHSEAGLTTAWEIIAIDGFMIKFSYWKFILSFYTFFLSFSVQIYTIKYLFFLTGSRIQEYQLSTILINIDLRPYLLPSLLTHFLSKDGQFRIYEYQHLWAPALTVSYNSCFFTKNYSPQKSNICTNISLCD